MTMTTTMTNTITNAVDSATDSAADAVGATRPQTLREARDAYFAASGFDESGYTDDWVDIPIGPLTFRFPNTAQRKQIIPLHDMHHALTGYSSSMMGELKIASFEIGGGIRRYWVGWILNLLTLSWGALLRPRTALRAFVRGRRSVNLYQRAPEPGLLDIDVEAVRAARGIAPIDERQPARAGDVAAFVGWSAVAVAVGVVGVALAPIMLALGLWGARGRKREAAA